jgi:hypothetical protein
MTNIERFTSEEILATDELYSLQDTYSCSGIPFEYVLTDVELGWLDFVKGCYSIHDWINERLEGDVLTFEEGEESLSEILEGDGMENKAVCLSDNTALQKLFFWLS